MLTRFEEYCRRKTEAAAHAVLSGFHAVRERPVARTLTRVGNEWSRALFDGCFYRSEARDGGLPSVNLVFVQSREGNTGADDPSSLGGGETDKHLVYEGLSRVDADAVLAGATTAREDDLVFSVWHPQMIALRQQLGHLRHPAQIIVTDSGTLPLDDALLFTEPSLRVFIVTSASGAMVLGARVQDRSWIEVIDTGQPLAFEVACRELCARGLRVISAVGGRRTAASLLRAGLVSDLYLTTSPISAGEPNTPLYDGPPLDAELVVEKRGVASEEGVLFQHFRINR